ncbi:hypothetical protein OsI_02210 [Oryza sativa Indica Group]|uniref:Uncharacterized protein n=1 Tax=Oryza sativa subsp. indica TaxID=39946 RepID=A2WQS6_ORYSI|nr:hypothetical protein OsI_02210 [Oryza sativa Indica Group]
MGRHGVGSPRLQRRVTASPDLVSPLGRGDRRRARSSPAPLRGPGREVASSSDGGGCGGDEVGDDNGGLRRVPRRRPSSRTSPPRGRRGALVNVPAVNAVPVTPSSMMPTTCASRCTSDPCHPGRIWTAGVWRRWLAMMAADGGGWTVVAGRGCPWRWRWRWRWWLTVAAGDGGGCGSGGGGCRRWYLWRRWLKAIIRLTATLEDAEEQGLQDNYVKLWLKELKDLALDAEDVLDDYRYELLQSQVQELQGDYPRKRKHMDNDEEDNDSIDERINEMINRFEEISRDRDALKLRFEDGHKIVDRGNWMKSRPTSHLIDESLVFGRIDEKEDIIKSVLSHQDMEPSGIVVLPIVGMGGIGKTTIAQMVYNDSRVRKHFEHSGWIHVSPTFDVHKLTIAITESLTMKNYGFTQLSLVHGVLLEEVQGKKLFFVLDDLWNECESSWQDFLSPLRHAQTVTILVTTRSKEVARLVQTVQLYHLGCIPDKDCWLLFQHYAFGNQHESEQSILVQIGRKILQKCGGLPLAVKSLGCLLRSTMDEHAWMEILESELWELDEEDNIFPALRLSYYWLPTRLKPCFLLCSLYPRNLGFTKDDIIQLWVAQGYIYSTNGKTCREIGNEYFNELHARSLD